MNDFRVQGIKNKIIFTQNIQKTMDICKFCARSMLATHQVSQSQVGVMSIPTTSQLLFTCGAFSYWQQQSRGGCGCKCSSAVLPWCWSVWQCSYMVYFGMWAWLWCCMSPLEQVQGCSLNFCDINSSESEFGESSCMECSWCLIAQYVKCVTDLRDILLVVADPCRPVVFECLASVIAGTDLLHKTCLH